MARYYITFSDRACAVAAMHREVRRTKRPHTLFAVPGNPPSFLVGEPVIDLPGAVPLCTLSPGVSEDRGWRQAYVEANNRAERAEARLRADVEVDRAP